MLSLLKRNIGKRFLSGKTFVFIVLCIGAMLSEYQHMGMDTSYSTSYLILEGPFAVFMQVVSPQNSTLISTVLMAVIVLSFLESPVVNQNDSFFIMRAGKTKWMLSEIAGVFLAGAIWVFLIQVMGCISSCNHMDWADWKIYPQNMRCMLIYFLAYVCIGLLILLFHALNIKALGTSIMVSLFLLEAFILDTLPNNIGVISESIDAKRVLAIVKKFTFMNRMENGAAHENFTFSVVYFLIIIVVATGLNMVYARRHEVG